MQAHRQEGSSFAVVQHGATDTFTLSAGIRIAVQDLYPWYLEAQLERELGLCRDSLDSLGRHPHARRGKSAGALAEGCPSEASLDGWKCSSVGALGALLRARIFVVILRLGRIGLVGLEIGRVSTAAHLAVGRLCRTRGHALPIEAD